MNGIESLDKNNDGQVDKQEIQKLQNVLKSLRTPADKNQFVKELIKNIKPEDKQEIIGFLKAQIKKEGPGLNKALLTKTMLSLEGNFDETQQITQQGEQTESKLQIESVKKLAKYFNIEDNEKLKPLVSKMEEIGLKPDEFLSKYKHIIETKLSGIKNIPNGNKYLEKIKLSIGRRFLSIDLEGIQERMDKGKRNGDISQDKTLKDFRWDVNESINKRFNFVNTQLIPSVQFLIKEGGKVDQRRGSGSSRENRKLKETLDMLKSEVLENGDFDKTWMSGELIDANTNSWSTFDTDDTLEGSTDTAILEHEGITEIESVDLLSEKDKKIEAKVMLSILKRLPIYMTPYIGDGYSVKGDYTDINTVLDGMTAQLRLEGVIPEGYNKLNTSFDSFLGGVGLMTDITAFIPLFGNISSFINKLMKGAKFAKILKRLKKLGISAEKVRQMMRDSVKLAKKGKEVLKGGRIDTRNLKEGDVVKINGEEYTYFINPDTGKANYRNDKDGLAYEIVPHNGDNILFNEKKGGVKIESFEKIKNIDNLHNIGGGLNFKELNKLGLSKWEFKRLKKLNGKLPEKLKFTNEAIKKYLDYNKKLEDLGRSKYEMDDFISWYTGNYNFKTGKMVFYRYVDYYDGIENIVSEQKIKIRNNLESIKKLRDKMIKSGEDITRISNDIKMIEKKLNGGNLTEEVAGAISHHASPLAGSVQEKSYPYIHFTTISDKSKFGMVENRGYTIKIEVDPNSNEIFRPGYAKDGKWVGSIGDGEGEWTGIGETKGKITLYKNGKEIKKGKSLSKGDKIKNATSISDLKKAIYEYGNIGEYTYDDIIHNIDLFLKGKIDETYITRTFNIREKVIELKNTEYIKKSKLQRLRPSGLNAKTQQGQVGNCYFVAALNTLKHHPNGGEILTNMITIESNNTFKVKFNGYPESIIITMDDINNMRYIKDGKVREGHIITDNIGDLILERAHARITNKIKGGKSNETFIIPSGKNKLNNSGGLSDETLKLFLGDKIKAKRIKKGFKKELNKGFEKYDFMGLSTSTEYGDMHTFIAKDYNGQEIELYYGHAYSIKAIDKSRGIVSVINPHNSERVMKFNINDIEKYFARLFFGINK